MSDTAAPPPDVAELVREAVLDVLPSWDKRPVYGSTRFVEDLAFDHLDLIEVVLDLERRFGIEINDDTAERLHTVDDLVATVRRLTA